MSSPLRRPFLALTLAVNDLGAFLRAELARRERLVRDAGIQPE